MWGETTVAPVRNNATCCRIRCFRPMSWTEVQRAESSVWRLFRVRLALFEPDIPQNAGTMMRLAACLGVSVDIIEPCGFILSDRHLRRAGMDYLDALDLTTHLSWDHFCAARAATAAENRLILLSTKAKTPYTGYSFAATDTILVGRESAGAPPMVHQAADAVLVVPMVAGARSLNVATAAAMALGEALRQTGRASAGPGGSRQIRRRAQMNGERRQ